MSVAVPAPTPQKKSTFLDRWNQPGPAGFYAWISEVQPHILGRGNTWIPFEPTQDQRKEIEEILTVDGNDNFTHTLSLLIEPRRMGKSTVFCLIILWLFTSRKNRLTQLLGNTESHSRKTQFNTLKKIIQNSPKLSKIVKPEWIFEYKIDFPPLSNTIQMSTGLSSATSFGEKINLLWVSDLHACLDLSPFNAFQASLLDSEDSLLFIDSNVDSTDQHVHALERESKIDDSMFCRRVEFKDLEDYKQNAPPWLDRKKAERMQRTALPVDFARDILGKRSDAKNALFTSDIIQLCKSGYKIPVSDISELTKGRAYKVGGGLDRAKSLMGNLDHTIWTSILKVASESGEPEYYLLNQERIFPNTGRLIKRAILRDHERYHLDNVTLENYEVTDLKSWLDDQRINNELISAHDTNQNAAFPELYRIAKEGRLHFPASLKDLASEMSTFTYTQKKGGTYTFGSTSRKFKDDRVYSACWAIFSMRESVLNLFEMGNIFCNNKSPKRALCFLLGGEAEMLCRVNCDPYKTVEEMYREYKQIRMDDDSTIQEFFNERVKLTGARIQQAV